MHVVIQKIKTINLNFEIHRYRRISSSIIGEKAVNFKLFTIFQLEETCLSDFRCSFATKKRFTDSS
jgi:hypothetical protein